MKSVIQDRLDYDFNFDSAQWERMIAMGAVVDHLWRGGRMKDSRRVYRREAARRRVVVEEEDDDDRLTKFVRFCVPCGVGRDDDGDGGTYARGAAGESYLDEDETFVTWEDTATSDSFTILDEEDDQSYSVMGRQVVPAKETVEAHHETTPPVVLPRKQDELPKVDACNIDAVDELAGPIIRMVESMSDSLNGTQWDSLNVRTQELDRSDTLKPVRTVLVANKGGVVEGRQGSIRPKEDGIVHNLMQVLDFDNFKEEKKEDDASLNDLAKAMHSMVGRKASDRFAASDARGGRSIGRTVHGDVNSRSMNVKLSPKSSQELPVIYSPPVSTSRSRTGCSSVASGTDIAALLLPPPLEPHGSRASSLASNHNISHHQYVLPPTPPRQKRQESAKTPNSDCVNKFGIAGHSGRSSRQLRPSRSVPARTPPRLFAQGMLTVRRGNDVQDEENDIAGDDEVTSFQSQSRVLQFVAAPIKLPYPAGYKGVDEMGNRVKSRSVFSVRSYGSEVGILVPQKNDSKSNWDVPSMNLDHDSDFVEQANDDVAWMDGFEVQRIDVTRIEI